MNKLTITAIVLFTIGTLLLMVGYMFEVLEFPQDLFRGIYTGPILMIAGIIVFAIGMIRKGKS